MTALALLRRFWPALPIAGCILLWLLWIADSARKDAKLQHLADVGQITVARINEGVARAEAADLRNANRVSALQEKVRESSNVDIERQLDEARSLAVAHARDQRLLSAVQTANGRVGQPSMSTFADAARRADAAGQTAELDDIACAEAVTKAEGWQAWWGKVSAIPR